MIGPEAEVGRGAPRGIAAERSVSELMRALTDDSMHLIRKEAELFRAETEAKIARLRHEAIALGAGAVLSLLGSLALVAAAILLLAEAMPPFLAALIVGAALVVAGTLSLASGKKRLAAEDLAPTKTTRSIREDARTIREAMR